MPDGNSSTPGGDWRTSGTLYSHGEPYDIEQGVRDRESDHGSAAHPKGGDPACPKCLMERARAREIADERKAEAALWAGPPDACAPVDLAFDLSGPQTARRWLVDRLIGADHNVIVSAVYKAGKTTLAVNLAAHLAAQEPFLGRETGGEWTGDIPVSYWNLEVEREDFNAEYVRGLDMPGGVCSAWDGKPAATRPGCPGWERPEWLWTRCGRDRLPCADCPGWGCPADGCPGRCQGESCPECVPGECCHDCPGDWRQQVRPVHLRSHPVPLLADGASGARERALSVLRGTRVWVIDTWSRFCAWHKVDPSDNAQVSGLTARLDEFKREAGIGCVVITAHAPHAAKIAREYERAIGAQSFSAWADALITLTRNEAGERFVSADGRGVSLPETRIEFAPGTTRLIAAGGSRADAQETALRVAVLSVVARVPGISVRGIREACGGHRAADVDQAVTALVKDGAVVVVKGVRGQASKHYAKGAEP